MPGQAPREKAAPRLAPPARTDTPWPRAPDSSFPWECTSGPVFALRRGDGPGGAPDQIVSKLKVIRTGRDVDGRDGRKTARDMQASCAEYVFMNSRCIYVYKLKLRPSDAPEPHISGGTAITGTSPNHHKIHIFSTLEPHHRNYNCNRTVNRP